MVAITGNNVLENHLRLQNRHGLFSETGSITIVLPQVDFFAFNSLR